MSFVPAPGYRPAYNPPLPYVASVMGGLWPGMAVYVQGVVSPSANRFHVNLASGAGEGADLALHLNPRFGTEGQVVLNSCHGGEWGPEQCHDLQPFTPGTPFEIVITVSPHAYRVRGQGRGLAVEGGGGSARLGGLKGSVGAHRGCMGSPRGILVNGSHFDEFLHRLPAEQVTAVTVDGDLELHAVTVLGGAVYSHHAGESRGGGFGGGGGVTLGRTQLFWGGPPSSLFLLPPPLQDMPQTIPYHHSHLPVMVQPPTLHPPVPFMATIPGGLIPKKTIVVKGYIPPDAVRFHINLRAGPGGDVLLHLNPRLEEGVVVRNSLLGGVWGSEEQDLPHNPFQRGRYFDLSIRCGNHRFKVFAEGQPLCNFSHRLPPGPHVDTLEVEGDVVLSYVHF
ncbi:galectin-4 [Morphnus guianensis]